DARITGGRRVHQLVQRHPVRAGQRQQQLQVGPARTGFQPGQRAHRDAGRRGQLGQGGLAPPAQRPQPGADRVQRPVEVIVHARHFARSATKIARTASGAASSASEVVMVTDRLRDEYDAVVIGGGAAGLSGALSLARSRRSVEVIDAGAPRNAPAEGVHGLLGREGIAPEELVERGRAEVRGYGGHVVTGEVASAARDGGGFRVRLTDGREARARRLLVATGLSDELPDLPGLRDRWGRDVLHCPYCHGWEVRDRAIGVLATGPVSVHQALLFRQLSEDVVFFAHAAGGLAAEQAEELAARGIRVVPGEVAAVEAEDGRLTGVRLADGTLVRREALAVASRMVARAKFLADLGLHPVEHPSGVGEYIPADATGRTDVPGVWAAGNVTELSAQVAPAAAAGLGAGAQINADLVAEETRQAVAARREALSREGGERR